MTRDEAIDLLQVMLLDERQPPALTPKGFIVRVDKPPREGGLSPRPNHGSDPRASFRGHYLTTKLES